MASLWRVTREDAPEDGGVLGNSTRVCRITDRVEFGGPPTRSGFTALKRVLKPFYEVNDHYGGEGTSVATRGYSRTPPT